MLSMLSFIIAPGLLVTLVAMGSIFPVFCAQPIPLIFVLQCQGRFAWKRSDQTVPFFEGNGAKKSCIFHQVRWVMNTMSYCTRLWSWQESLEASCQKGVGESRQFGTDHPRSNNAKNMVRTWKSLRSLIVSSSQWLQVYMLGTALGIIHFHVALIFGI